MHEKETISETLYDLYKKMGLPLDSIGPESGFTIHFLQDTFTRLPFKSIPYRPNYFSFIFVTDAYGRYTIDEMTFNIEPGTIYFTNPGNYRHFEWNAITDACLITFNEAYLKEQVHQDVYRDFSFLLSETVGPRILKKEQFLDIEQVYRQIHREYLGSSPYRNRIIGSLFVVLLLKIKEYFWQDYNPIYEGSRSSGIVKTFRKNLEDHYRKLMAGKADKVYRLQDYAGLQHLHPNYLTTVIKTKTGKSVSTWIAEKTIAEARSLLQNAAAPIKEITYLLGFREPTHFSNYFKKHTGLSPLAYRKRYNATRS